MPMDAGNGKQRRHDKFDLLAKEQGYRNRAAFKLLQLDTLFRFLPTARAVLDLCAAPGGWLQVAVSRAAPGAFVVGVDLIPIRPISGSLSLKEDITASARCGAAVRRLMGSRGVASFEVVLHDGVGRKKKRGNCSMCGGTSASAAQEATTTQSALVMDAVRLATMFLAPNGTFITKFFRCQDYKAVMFCLKQLFERVHLSRPVASRSMPAEIYAICLRYKAPVNVQPELLDLKHLHLLSVDAEKSKRQESTEFWKTGLASDFVWSEAQTPLEFLGSFLTISFDDPASLPIKNHELTTDEIKQLCEYLFVLRENGYNHLLKWRMRIRKALSPKADGTATDSKGRDGDQLLHEEEDLKNIVHRKRMRVKHQSRPHAKGKAHKASGMQIDATEDSYGDPDLFPICAIELSCCLHSPICLTLPLQHSAPGVFSLGVKPLLQLENTLRIAVGINCTIFQ